MKLDSLDFHGLFMPYTFDQSKDEIARLVRHFSTNQNAFLSSTYKEAQAREEFIDPLFIALNWDVRNQQQTAPDYREVVVEDSLEMEGHEARKAPDYVFRIGRERKFFAEAKKPGVDLKMATGPAYQLRRYAWSAKLLLSVLTDFQEWVAYDCRVRPSEGDKPSMARLVYMTFEEYADRWREVWDIFSREAVWGGSFDKFAQGSKGKRGTSEVDAEFLKEIEGWRNSLAHNIALRNPGLTIDEMNDAVQRTIDRIIFLRMCEASGMEEYAQLQRIAEGEDIYAGLLALSKKADTKYNSGLFDFSKSGDHVTPRLTVDDKTLKPILADLYYPQSPYEFSVLPAEILGNVYEQFLGKVIHLTESHHAKVEEKPEVKKAGGVYYTPSYIVEYIVKNTVGKQIEGKSPAKLEGFRILDPACGSGSFLLGAYTLLLEYYRDWYSAHEPGKHKEAVVLQSDGSWQLNLPERKRILIDHIFGVDIDRQACEVTKLSLLLKVLEGVKQLTLFTERVLPNLDDNIKCGNSLIEPDYFTGQMMQDTEDLRRVNPFDWKQGFPEAMRDGGFDCVIGNPPYSAKQSLETKKLTDLFHAVEYKCDPYAFFIEQGFNKSKLGGMLGYIVPVTWMTNYYYFKLRELLINSESLSRLILIEGLVFKGANVDTCILFLDKNSVSRNGFEWSHTKPSKLDAPFVIRSYQSIQVEERLAISPEADPVWINIKNKADSVSERLDTITKISLGMKLRSNDEFVSRKQDRNHSDPICFGDDISRFGPIIPTRFFNFSDAVIVGGTKRPAIHKTKPKIFIQAIRNLSLKRRIVATVDKEGICFVGTVNGVTLLLDHYNIYYLLGIINSKFLNTYFRKRFTTISLTAAFLGVLPIPKIDKSISEELIRHDKIVSLVEQMLDLHKRKAEAKDAGEKDRLQRVIESTDQQIDALVYALYGLTPEEIAIVEDANE